MSVLSLDEVSMNQPNNLVERFALCVNGNLNESSLGFIHSINQANPAGLSDLITKLKNLRIQVQAETIDMIIHTLNFQLPYNTLQTIQEFLLDETNQITYQKLRTLGEDSKLQQSIFYMMDKLQILTGEGSSEQVLRTIISVMLEWSSDQRTPQNAALWLKTMLNLPSQSVMAQIIHLIADHFYLSECILPGKTRNMDAFELFFLLRNLTANTELMAISEPNKKFIQQIYAAILTSMIYKNSPYAFYDVVLWHEKHPDFSILTALQAQYTETLLIEKFLQNSDLKPYFPQQRYQSVQINQHIFLSSLASYMHNAVQSDIPKDSNTAKILNFAQDCAIAFQQKDRNSFMQWFQYHPNFEIMELEILSSFFQVLHSQAAVQKSRQAGRIRANAMQLVALGFSHRSAATQSTGAFIPLVNIDIATIDVDNLTAVIEFFKQQATAERLKLLQEIFLNYVLYVQSIQKYYAETDQSTAEKTEALAPINTSTYKPTVAKVFRENPLDRNRLFTPKAAIPARDVEVKATFRRQ